MAKNMKITACFFYQNVGNHQNVKNVTFLQQVATLNQCITSSVVVNIIQETNFN